MAGSSGGQRSKTNTNTTYDPFTGEASAPPGWLSRSQVKGWLANGLDDKAITEMVKQRRAFYSDGEPDMFVDLLLSAYLNAGRSQEALDFARPFVVTNPHFRLFARASIAAARLGKIYPGQEEWLDGIWLAKSGIPFTRIPDEKRRVLYKSLLVAASFDLEMEEDGVWMANEALKLVPRDPVASITGASRLWSLTKLQAALDLVNSAQESQNPDTQSVLADYRYDLTYLIKYGKLP